jgi:hypothetical protein
MVVCGLWGTNTHSYTHTHIYIYIWKDLGSCFIHLISVVGFCLGVLFFSWCACFFFLLLVCRNVIQRCIIMLC